MPFRLPSRRVRSDARIGARRRGGVRWWVILLFGGYLLYYWMSHQQEASFTGRSQLVDTTAQQDAALGLQAYQQILSQSDVVSGGELPQQVRQIAERLIRVAPAVEKELAQQKGVPASTDWSAFDWDVNVIDSPQVNAFCLPGGKIAVYTGIIPVAENANALAAVMGHE
ncbi:MAG: M48 family metalloprotease, partial [Xanthomonadales bacterium]|nr:M48 family metalloprotease [Xanthomonadales bacterium]